MDELPSARFQLVLLGRFELRGPEGPVSITGKKLAALMAFLACTSPRPHGRDRLMTLLWGSHFDTQARQNLRQALTRLRRILGDDALVSSGEMLSLRAGVVASDVARFEVLLGDRGGNSLPEAVGLYGGRLLADLSIVEEAWSEWLEAERRRLEGLALDAMVRLGEQALQRDDHGQALEAAGRAIAVSSLREDAHRLMMRAQAGGGRRADALRHYEYVTALLKRELNVEPDAATVALAAELRTSRTPRPGTEARSRSQPEVRELGDAAGPRNDDILDCAGAGQRKHITVLYVDLGESLALLARRDAEEALKVFDALLAVMTESIRRCDGTVNLVTNDGLMALFGAPIAHEDHALRACYAALHLQEATARKARELQGGLDIPVAVRAGLASGEVVIRPQASGAEMPSMVMGSVAHLARGIMEMAAPGGLLVNIETQRLAEGHFDFRPRAAVNCGAVDETVYELVGLPTGRTRFQVLAERGLTGFVRLLEPDKPSIAVLPFKNMSGDPEQEYFVDGLVEDITTALSRIAWLFVIARNSSFTYKGRVVDPRQVGRELGVRYVLEGSVRKAGNRLRISGEVIDAVTGNHIWADRYDGALEDVFHLQDSITSNVVAVIAPKVLQAEIARAQAKPTNSLTAYDLYLRAVALGLEQKPESYLQALTLLYRAIELDPNYSSAYGHIAHCHWNRLILHAVPLGEEQGRGLEAAKRAVETGRDNPDALARGGLGIALLGGRPDEGLPHLERALALNPNSVVVVRYAGFAYGMVGDFVKALALYERTMELNPLDPHAFDTYLGIALVHLFAGRFEEAIGWANRALRERPELRPALHVKGAAMAAADRPCNEVEEVVRRLLTGPGTSIKAVRERMLGWRQVDVDSFAAALRKAGLPE